MEHPENKEIGNNELTHQALSLFVEKMRRENAETRSWIRQPNNFISAVAIVLSLMGIAYQIYRDWTDGVNQDLASLSKTASDLTQLDYQTATATNLSDDYRVFVNNRRTVLVAEASRLIKALGNKVPPAQLAAIAPEYAQIGDSSTALKYLQLLTQPSSSPAERLSGWRSIAVLYADEGPDKFEDARNAFAEAANVYTDPKDFGPIGLELTVREQWATFESAAQNYVAEFQNINEARLLLNRYPCMPGREAVVARVDAEGQRALDHLLKSDPAKASSNQLAWNEVTSADKCPKTATPPPAPNAIGQFNSGGTTTVCRFTSGPRAGTVFDFKQFGVQGIPVGSPCTDGQGSNGTAL